MKLFFKLQDLLFQEANSLKRNSKVQCSQNTLSTTTPETRPKHMAATTATFTKILNQRFPHLPIFCLSPSSSPLLANQTNKQTIPHTQTTDPIEFEKFKNGIPVTTTPESPTGTHSETQNAKSVSGRISIHLRVCSCRIGYWKGMNRHARMRRTSRLGLHPLPLKRSVRCEKPGRRIEVKRSDALTWLHKRL